MCPGKYDGERWEGVAIRVLRNKYLVLKSSKEIPEQELKQVSLWSEIHYILNLPAPSN